MDTNRHSTLARKEKTKSSRYVVTHAPVEAVCTKPRCSGAMWRLDLSRLEEGLGHEGFACDKCGLRVKYVPSPEKR